MNIKQFLGLSYYISELDAFLKELDQRHQRLSASQRAEKEKYQYIYQLRDEPSQATQPDTLWDTF